MNSAHRFSTMWGILSMNQQIMDIAGTRTGNSKIINFKQIYKEYIWVESIIMIMRIRIRIKTLLVKVGRAIRIPTLIKLNIHDWPVKEPIIEYIFCSSIVLCIGLIIILYNSTRLPGSWFSFDLFFLFHCFLSSHNKQTSH